MLNVKDLKVGQCYMIFYLGEMYGPIQYVGKSRNNIDHVVYYINTGNEVIYSNTVMCESSFVYSLYHSVKLNIENKHSNITKY